MKDGDWLLPSLFMFLIGLIGASLLIFGALFSLRRRIKGQELNIDLNRITPDRAILNFALAGMILLECATLVWDSVNPAHFPVGIRWPLDFVFIGAISVSSVRLFRFYLHAWFHGPHDAPDNPPRIDRGRSRFDTRPRV